MVASEPKHSQTDAERPASASGKSSSTPLESLIATGTKLWLDSIDPDLVQTFRGLGATGATSNPVIVGDILKSGRFDADIRGLITEGLDDSAVAWQMTDRLVADAQKVFQPIWAQTAGNDGYVSFELDPLIEDPEFDLPLADRVSAYAKLGQQWSAGHDNRMIKVPATEAGIEALEGLVAHGVSINVTLIFTQRQYEAARDAVWRGAQQRPSLEGFKSVYSVFVSRIDAYARKHMEGLSEATQDQIGIVNAKRVWQSNQAFWASHATPLEQEIVFASTGTKDPNDVAWKYVAAFAGSGIETNPPQTNDATQASGESFQARIHEAAPADVLAEIDAEVDFETLESALMEEGIRKFADPHKALLAVIAEKRRELQP